MIESLRKPAYLLVAMALLLQACATASVEAPAPEPTTLKVATQPYLGFAPFFIAEKEGYFAEQGLEVEFVRLTPKDIVPAVVQGEADVTACLVSAAVLNAIARGGRVKIVADQDHVDPTGCASIALVARRSLVEAGVLENPDRMKGMRVDVLPASWNDYYLSRVLAAAGLAVDDLELTNVPSAAEMEALDKGALDLVTIGEPWLTRVVQAGHLPILTPVQELMPGSQTAVVLYSSRLLDEDPDAGTRFMIAYLKAARQLNEGKTERNVQLLAEFTELDQALLEEACWPVVRHDGTVDVESVLRFQEWAVEAGFVEEPVSEEQFWDPSFVEQANQILGASPQ